MQLHIERIDNEQSWTGERTKIVCLTFLKCKIISGKNGAVFASVCVW